MDDKALVERIRNRTHDAPIPTEHLLDEAADRIELLQTVLEITSEEKIRTIEALQARVDVLEAALREICQPANVMNAIPIAQQALLADALESQP